MSARKRALSELLAIIDALHNGRSRHVLRRACLAAYLDRYTRDGIFGADNWARRTDYDIRAAAKTKTAPDIEETRARDPRRERCTHFLFAVLERDRA